MHSFFPPLLPSGIPVLDEERKSNGKVNLNYSGYLYLSKGYMQGSLYLLHHYPQFYLNTLGKCIQRYFISTRDIAFPKAINFRDDLKTFSEYFNLLCCGQMK